MTVEELSVLIQQTQPMVICSRCGNYGPEEEGDFDQGQYICRKCCDEEMAEAEEYLNHMRQVSKEGR